MATRGARRSPRRRLDLRKTLFILPNMLTLGSLVCGFNAIRVLAEADGDPRAPTRAALFLLFSMLLDLLDGRVARLTRTQSAFGLQLDSLVDLVSFGVAPALLLYTWVLREAGTAGVVAASAYLGAAACRLARFNVLSSGESGKPLAPGKYIVGLPVPPACGVLLSLVIANDAVDGALGAPANAPYFVAIMALLAALMVSNVRFRSFKDLRATPAAALVVLFMLTSSALIWRHFDSAFVLTWMLGLYIALALGEALRGLARRAHRLLLAGSSAGDE